MLEERRYILIDKTLITPDILAETEITEQRFVKFAGDPVEYSVLKWAGIKPTELWNEFPIYSSQEMSYILDADILIPKPK